jgi:large subunit ribosomal protein L10e
MSRKPGSMYRRVRGKISTRKEYMGGIPNSRITQFVLGNKKSDFPITVSLIVNEECQVRHNALEAARITSNRTMDKKVGGANYRLTVRSYPHVVLRENKQATGAGADRVSQGMRSAFGKIVSVAAKINRNQIIMTIETTEQNINFAKDALRKAGMKLPSPCKIQIENNT